MQPLHLLLVEDNALDAELTLAQLERADYAVEAQIVYDEVNFVAQLESTRFDVILADFVMPTFSGIEALTLAMERAPDTPFIFVSGLLGEEHAVEMLKRGATDYVLKQRLQRLPAVVRRAMREAAERQQRIAVERVLRETETHFRLLVDALKDYAVITLDPEGRIRTWNAASERILGYPAQDVVGRSASVFLSPEDREAGVFEEELATARREGSASDDRWLWRKDGHSFFASGVTTAIRTESHELIGFSKIIRDATEAHMAADALRLAKEQAETANRAKDHFLAVLSHELRTPLTPILAAVRLLEMKRQLADDALPTLDLIRRNVELEARLIDDLLDLTSIARGKLSLNFTHVVLDTLMTSALDMSVSDLRAKGLSLDTRFEAGGSLVLGDAARLQQIVWNLMKNAVKFTPSDGRIEVRTWNPDASTIAVSVADSGIGISAEALPRIFSAFEQADDSITRAFGGLGLGLAIASTLAQKHGGTLTAQSEGRDKGARFTLTLPLVKAEPEHESSPNATAEPNAAGRSLKVLLVEDNEYTSSAMAEVLEVLGHQVAVASTVGEALALAKSDSFDLLVSDIGLPDGSGLDVARAWQDLQPGKPSVAITGYGMDEDIRRCREAGFDDHLTKPVNFARLEALIHLLAQKPASE
ncbi:MULTISPECIES: response regulator [unclassified Caballeronia]|uniref:hybrid sensor histidine kinase/response regulator n=1 Tax=unclassified Caballeronia TaxID=2646786 RepID=UPI00286690A5|nr:MULTISPECIES: response regulator [unclassified Caballeronia]MDR5750503.1 response regulator [Caballeronia sp. LZ024]MDR5842464.1 response regulator [Caballeronia sp. LZ031]